MSIPIFTTQLEKAREATDLANIRGAYAEAVADAITAAPGEDGKYSVTKTTEKLQSTGAIDQVASEKCGPWESSKITVTKGQTATITGASNDGVTWTWTLSGGASATATTGGDETGGDGNGNG